MDHAVLVRMIRVDVRTLRGDRAELHDEGVDVPLLLLVVEGN